MRNASEMSGPGFWLIQSTCDPSMGPIRRGGVEVFFPIAVAELMSDLETLKIAPTKIGGCHRVDAGFWAVFERLAEADLFHFITRGKTAQPQ